MRNLIVLLVSSLPAQEVMRPVEHATTPMGSGYLFAIDAIRSQDALFELVLDDVPPGSYGSVSFRPFFVEPRSRPTLYLHAQVDGSWGTASCASANVVGGNLRPASTVRLLTSAHVATVPQLSPEYPGASFNPEPWHVTIPFDVPWVVPQRCSCALAIDSLGSRSDPPGVIETGFVDGAYLNKDGTLESSATMWVRSLCGVETYDRPGFFVIQGAPYLRVPTHRTSSATTLMATVMSFGPGAPISLPVRGRSCELLVAPWGALVWAKAPYASEMEPLPLSPTLTSMPAWCASIEVSSAGVEGYSGTFLARYPSTPMLAGAASTRVIGPAAIGSSLSPAILLR